jgi:hypothetical protein
VVSVIDCTLYRADGCGIGVAIEDWFGLSLPMQGVKSTSMVYHGIEAIRDEPYACFCEEDSNHCHLELYPRPNGTIPNTTLF